MRIAYLLPNLHLTGGSRVGVELGERLASKGHAFYILIPAGRKKIAVSDNVNVVECGFRVKSPLTANLTGMLGMIARLPQVDLIMASMPTYALLAGFAGKIREIPAVNYILNDDVHFFDDKTYIKSDALLSLYRFIARLSLKRITSITNSHWTAVQCVSEGGQRPKAIVQSGYDPRIFFCSERRTEPCAVAKLVAVGRKARWKGFDDMISALNLVDREKFPFHLRLITQDDLDFSRAAFSYEIVKPVSDEELAEAYRWGEIFIHSSWFEGFGLPPLEAQACGLAVVSTDSGGVREFLRDGTNSFLVPPREPRTFARKIEQMIEDFHSRTRFIDSGLQTCREFTWDRIADKLESALNDIIESG